MPGAEQGSELYAGDNENRPTSCPRATFYSVGKKDIKSANTNEYIDEIYGKCREGRVYVLRMAATKNERAGV